MASRHYLDIVRYRITALCGDDDVAPPRHLVLNHEVDLDDVPLIQLSTSVECPGSEVSSVVLVPVSGVSPSVVAYLGDSADLSVTCIQGGAAP